MASRVPHALRVAGLPSVSHPLSTKTLTSPLALLTLKTATAPQLNTSRTYFSKAQAPLVLIPGTRHCSSHPLFNPSFRMAGQEPTTPKEVRKYLQQSHDRIFENNKKWAEEMRKKKPEFFKDLSAGQSPEYLWIGKWHLEALPHCHYASIWHQSVYNISRRASTFLNHCHRAI